MASIFPPDSGSEQPETLLEFPCEFPVKAMGRHDAGSVSYTHLTLPTNTNAGRCRGWPGG